MIPIEERIIVLHYKGKRIPCAVWPSHSRKKPEGENKLRLVIRDRLALIIGELDGQRMVLEPRGSKTKDFCDLLGLERADRELVIEKPMDTKENYIEISCR